MKNIKRVLASSFVTLFTTTSVFAAIVADEHNADALWRHVATQTQTPKFFGEEISNDLRFTYKTQGRGQDATIVFDEDGNPVLENDLGANFIKAFNLGVKDVCLDGNRFGENPNSIFKMSNNELLDLATRHAVNSVDVVQALNAEDNPTFFAEGQSYETVKPKTGGIIYAGVGGKTEPGDQTLNDAADHEGNEEHIGHFTYPFEAPAVTVAGGIEPNTRGSGWNAEEWGLMVGTFTYLEVDEAKFDSGLAHLSEPADVYAVLAQLTFLP